MNAFVVIARCALDDVVLGLHDDFDGAEAQAQQLLASEMLTQYVHDVALRLESGSSQVLGISVIAVDTGRPVGAVSHWLD